MEDGNVDLTITRVNIEYQEKLRKRREEALLDGIICTYISLLYHYCVLIVQALNFSLHDDKVHI